MFTVKINFKNLLCAQFYTAGEGSAVTEYLGI